MADRMQPYPGGAGHDWDPWLARHGGLRDAYAGAPVAPGSTPSHGLSAVELAFLAGGPRRAMLTSVANLVERRVLREDLTVLRELTPDDDPNPLDRAVVTAGRAGAPSFTDLRSECAPALDALRDSLASRGLALDQHANTQLRWAGRIATVVVSLMAAACFFTLDDRINLIPVFIAVVCMSGIRWCIRRSGRNREAGAVLEAERARHLALQPEYAPAYPSYGVGALALGTALFGTGALTLAVPALAADPTVLALGSHGTSSGSDSFSSGGSTSSGCSTSSCSGGGGGDSGGGDGGCGGGGCGGCGGGGGGD